PSWASRITRHFWATRCGVVPERANDSSCFLAASSTERAVAVGNMTRLNHDQFILSIVMWDGTLEALFDFDVDAEGAILVAQAHDGYVAIYVVFHLNDLLLCRTHIGNISNREIAGDLLLDRDARRRVLFRTGRPKFGQSRVHAKT